MSVIEKTYALTPLWSFLEPADGDFQKHAFNIKLKDGDQLLCHFLIPPGQSIDVFDLRFHNIASPQGQGYGYFDREIMRDGSWQPVNNFEGHQFFAWPDGYAFEMMTPGTKMILLHDDEFHAIRDKFDMRYSFHAVEPAGAELWVKSLESYIVYRTP